MLPTRSLLPFFLAPALLASAASQAAMEALDRGAAAGGSIGGPACPGTGRAPTSRLCFRSGFARSFLRKPTVLFLRDSALQRCDKMPPTPLQRHAACLAPVEALC
ncbi:hypothetical protein M770_27895 [Pseudomonas aeruginosa VRFPA03]|nr:hypothetical protein M770_27895 [Pseudomonas aeruginosa VRFPA03]